MPWPAFATSISDGFVYNPLVIDVGGGLDYKLFFKNFSWRFQGDYMHTHYAQRHAKRLPRLHRNRLALLSLPTSIPHGI